MPQNAKREDDTTGGSETDPNYFAELAARAERLNQAAQQYIDQHGGIPVGMSIDDMTQAITRWCWAKFEEEYGGSWGKMEAATPWWVSQTVDQGVPCASPPKSGSVASSLGYSPVSAEANVLAMYLYTKGKHQTGETDLPLMASIELSEEGKILPAQW